MTVEQTLRVTGVRSQNPRGFGGCIFTGKAVDGKGRLVDGSGFWVVRATELTLGGVEVAPGQWWTVRGTPTVRMTEVNGYEITETQLEAAEAVMQRPSGEHIITFIADNPAFHGVGQVKARKLWDAFGESLYEHLDAGNVAELAVVLTPESAAQVAAAWAQQGDSRTLQWLQAQGLGLALGRKVLQFFGPQTAQKLEEEPYRLLSFCATWRQTDALARTHFGIAVDDPRRLQGAVEEACYRAFTAGHTSMLTSELMDVLQGVLGAQSKTFKWRSLISAAMSQGLSNGSFVVGHHGLQPLGAMVMERQVAQAVADRLAAAPPALLPSDEVDELLSAYEKAESMELNLQQRKAVHLAAAKPLVLITGGAGVGKTTVLKALYGVYDRAGISVTQLALAGRAAKRMEEATSRPASTIASFLRGSRECNFDMRSVVIVDEASMVDIITMSQLCSLLGSSPRLVLVGDPAQLMPVGPGLVLHALTQVPQVPVAKLIEVKRYGGDIAAAAAAIREGRWLELPHDPDAAIGFIPCSAASFSSTEASIPETVLQLYMRDPANTQVLCARRHGVDGTKALNSLCQSVFTADAKAVQVWDGLHDTYARVGFHLGDPILCTRNLWDRGLQNGSLGVVVQVDDEPSLLANDEGEATGLALAWADWDDGVRRPIVEEMLDDLELGYAITVHKAQGSQWPRVIVPLTGHRLLDRSLVYTAVTRAQQQVLLVGDEGAARRAVQGLPRVQRRQVSLDLHIAALMSQRDIAPPVSSLSSI